MEQVDERILEFLDSVGWASPRIMAKERGFESGEGRIRERCERLLYAGLVSRMHSDMYEITRWGVLYLEGEIDAEHQPKPTVDRVLRNSDANF
jgi:hypothetical protein